jgi:c-di-GMP-binding flagellar brake protein YcgR
MIESAPPPTTIEKPFVERRLFRRLRARGAAAFRPAEKPLATGIPITLVDISHGGVGFIVARQLTVGQQLIIDMQSPIGSARPVSLEAEVRWTLPAGKPGQVRVGCAWMHRLEFADLQRFT